MLFSTATIPGSAHTVPGKPGKINNQDAIAVRTHGETTVVVLTDGCGSQPRSETGADIGANLTANIIMGQIKINNVVDWPKLPEEILSSLATIIELVKDESFDDALLQRFMFTLCVAVIHEEKVTVAFFGDGYMIVDDLVIPFESPIPNTPAYIGYLLREDSPYHQGELRANLNFQIVYDRPVTDIKKSLILSTDGIRDLNVEDIHHPGLLSTPQALQQWLASQNLEYIDDEDKENIEIVPGPCRDDVTMVLIRTEQSQQQLLKSRSEIVKLKMAYNDLLASLHKTCDKWRKDAPIRHVHESQLEEYYERAKILYEIAEDIDAVLDCKELSRKVHEKISDLKAIPVWAPCSGMYGMYGSRGAYQSVYPSYHAAHDDDDYMMITHGAESVLSHGPESFSPEILKKDGEVMAQAHGESRSLKDEKPLPILLPASSWPSAENEAKSNRGWIRKINKKHKKSGNKRR